MSLQHVDIVFQIAVFLFAISVHESAHAWMASRCGDPTARMLGRVTLNPIRHIDPLGTIFLPAVALLYHFPMIGWAKPTPVNPVNFRRPVRDDILTSVAGPVSNLAIALAAVIVMATVAKTSAEGHTIVYNLARYGMVTETDSILMPVALLFYEAMIINVLLMVFNLIPVPPLDGSHVLRHMLSEPVRRMYDRVGFIGLVLLFVVGGKFIAMLMTPFLNFFNGILTNL